MAQAAALTKAPARQAPARVPPRPFLQTRLEVGPANDRFEREADSVAAAVTSDHATPLSIPPTITPIRAPAAAPQGLAQRACSACGMRDEDRRIQRKCASCGTMAQECHCEEKEDDAVGAGLRVDRFAESPADEVDGATRSVAAVVATPGRPLPAEVRDNMEQGFGRDFSRVRIHDSAHAAASARDVGAHAYTVGHHIVFNRGRFQPETSAGRFLLAHELAHAVQQSGAPRLRPAGVSQPGDHHETQANQAAKAAVAGAPMPALSPSEASISRVDLGDVAMGALRLGPGMVGGLIGQAAWELGGDSVVDALSALMDTARAIARAVGGHVRRDGLTLVIDFPEVSPCPEFEIDFQLSDIGLDPTLYFPIAAGAFTVGPLTLLGALGVTANVDPGFKFRLEGCTFGPGEIRLGGLPPSVSVTGAASIATGTAYTFGSDLGLRADLAGLLVIPTAPPTPLIVPAVGITAGGALVLMFQHRGNVSHTFSVNMGIGSFSASQSLRADLGYSLDLATGLFGSVDVLGLNLCRVGWPLGNLHEQFAVRLALDVALSVGLSGFDFDFDASLTPIDNPLDDLSFPFDQSRLFDNCPLCDFFTDNNLMPGQNGYNWANIEPTLPRLPGPLPLVYARNPGLASGALCRGTCGIDCPPPPSCDEPVNRVECVNSRDRHFWYTYENYATCGTHQGCRDHDACYDYAATMPIWGFGGTMIGPMYRACDLEAMCGYSFKQGVTWAMGGGPYDGRIPYADRVTIRPGCLGPCPKKVTEGEEEVLQTCIDDRELLAPLELSDSWRVDFGQQRLYQGFAPVPWIGGIHYGVDAAAHADAGAFAEFGPVNLEGACLNYDPATGVYTGSAELVAYLNGGASASITGSLTGWGADVFCLAAWLSLRGKLFAEAGIELPSEVRARVRLECRNGDLQVIPDLSMQVCPTLSGGVGVGVDFFVLGFHVWGDEWPLVKKSISRCWQVGFEFDPFSVGQPPDFRIVSTALDVANTILDFFGVAERRSIEPRRPARSPIPDPRVLLPCLGDDDEEEEENADCPRKATGAEGDRLTTEAERAPTYGGVSNLAIGAGAGAASWMEARFLTSSHEDGEETNSTVQRGIYRQPGLPTKDCVRKGFKQSQVYIKGHLLNAGAGGPAEERNLFPITGQANSDHKNMVEQGGLRVVPRVNSGNEVIYYKVTVQNVSSPREILTSNGDSTDFWEISARFHCEVADYQLCTNDTLRRNPVQTVNIQSDFVFHPSGGSAFDTIMRPCPRT